MSLGRELSIFGVTIDRVSWLELDRYCQDALAGDRARQIVTANGEILLRAFRDKNYAALLNQADLVIAESTNVALVALWKGAPVREITAGADLVERLSQIAAKQGRTIYLLGGRPGIAQKAAAELARRNFGLKIVGVSSADPTDLSIPAQIRHAEAEIVLVAYGAPKQEEWIAAHKAATGAKILIGVGGTFDMLSGVTPRSPYILRYLHLEWLWRLFLQPSRIGRIWNAVVVFPVKAILERKD